MGFKRKILSPVGGDRHGVIIIEDFYKKFLGVSDIPNDIKWWFFVPEHSLSTATNGRIFYGENSDFIKVRNNLLKGYPHDVKLKKLAEITWLNLKILYNKLQRFTKGRDIDG